MLQTLLAPNPIPVAVAGILSGATAGSVLFAGSGGILSQNNVGLNWNDSSKTFTASGNAAALQTPPSGTTIVFSQADGTSPRFLADSYGITSSAAPQITGRAARGTSVTPSALKFGDGIVAFTGFGFGTTVYSSARARITFMAAEDWTDAAHGTNMTFTSTALGSTTALERMRLFASGGLNLGATVDPGPGSFSALTKIGIVEAAFASRPVSPTTGDLCNFSDSNTAIWGATIAGSGANHVLGRWNGTNWTVVGV